VQLAKAPVMSQWCPLLAEAGRSLVGHALLVRLVRPVRPMRPVRLYPLGCRPPRSEKAEWATDLGFSQPDRFDLSSLSHLSLCAPPKPYTKQLESAG